MNRTTKLLTLGAVSVLALALALMLGQLSSAAGATAHKRAASDGCISSTEFNTAQRGTMSWFQATYSTGTGTIVLRQSGGDHVIKQYPWCNHYPTEGYFQVAYDKNKLGQYMANTIVWYDFTCNADEVICGHHARTDKVRLPH